MLSQLERKLFLSDASVYLADAAGASFLVGKTAAWWQAAGRPPSGLGLADWPASRQADRQADRQEGGHAGRQAGRQVGGQSSKGRLVGRRASRRNTATDASSARRNSCSANFDAEPGLVGVVFEKAWVLAMHKFRLCIVRVGLVHCKNAVLRFRLCIARPLQC